MIVYVENPNDSTKRLLKLMKKLSKVAGYKINIQKSVVSITTSYQTEKFTVASKRINYLEINLTKEVKHLYSKNYKTLMKEMEK